jgi:hypothetical protein
MSAGQARSIYESTKNEALAFARDLVSRITKR